VDVETFEKKFKKFRQGYKPLVQYKVKFGDTIAKIAQMSGATAKEICDLNGLGKNDRIFAGSHLIVPKPIGKTKADANAKKQVIVVPGKKFDPAGKKRTFYPVAGGDTLSQIALFFRVKVTDLCTWNDLDPQEVIVTDMVLQLYVDPDFDLSSANVLDEKDAEIFEAGSDAHLDYLVEKEGRKRVEYTVNEGDTISTIAKKFKVKKYSISSINRISPGKALNAGDIIILYVDPKTQKKYFPKKKKKASKEPHEPEESKEPAKQDKPQESEESQEPPADPPPLPPLQMQENDAGKDGEPPGPDVNAAQTT
ncbi:MAG: LysM peptidoglycan-binding domain-containing protein, partial [Pseudomonadota bacterium]